MKNRLFLNALLLCLVIAGFQSVSNGGEIPKADYIEVTPKVVLAKHGYGANITCLATNGGLYFVDCGLNTELALRFRQDMEKKFHKKTLALLVTHPHFDHFLGMGAFSDVQVVAAKPGESLWKRQLAIEFNEERVDPNLINQIEDRIREEYAKTAVA